MDWDCDHCSFRNKGTTSRCRVCNLKSHQQRSSLMSTSLVEISCPRCTLLNPQNSSSCEVCGHTFLPKEKNPSPPSRSSSSNDENRSGSEEEDDESDCEEKMLFELISEQIDEFVETIKQSNEIRYRCKFDGRICGTKSIMCAYVARRHKAAALEQLKKKESRDRKRDGVQSDEALAWKLAILDSQIVATNGKGGRKRPQTGGTTLRSTSLPSSSSSRRTVPVLPPKTEPRKKREYTPLPPSAYFRNRQQQTASAATVAPKTLKPKVEFSLSHEDKETRLKKLLQKSDQIVSRLAQLIPAPPTSAQTSDQTTTTRAPLASSYASHSVEHTDTETPCSLPGDPIEVSDLSIINDSDRNPTVLPTVIEYPLLQGCTLRSYQSAGVEWLCGLHDAGLNGILADEMGLGLSSHFFISLAISPSLLVLFTPQAKLFKSLLSFVVFFKDIIFLVLI
jgi:SNF2 family DNA or RNA helicase